MVAIYARAHTSIRYEKKRAHTNNSLRKRKEDDQKCIRPTLASCPRGAGGDTAHTPGTVTALVGEAGEDTAHTPGTVTNLVAAPHTAANSSICAHGDFVEKLI